MEEVYKNLLLEDCHTIIYNDLKQTNVEVVSYKTFPFSEKIEGLLGQHFKLEITYKTKGNLKTNSYFMKVLNGSSKVIFEMCTSVNAYEKEDLFYNVLVKEFRRFNIDTDFVPQYYFSKPYLIVLENMSLKNYTSNTNVDLDVNHCKRALKIIAKLHSGSMLYEAAKSKELGKPYSLFNTYPNLLKNYFFTNEKNFANEWLYKSMEGIHELIKFIPENHIKKEDYQKVFLRFVDRMNQIETSFTDHTQTLLHGDLWCNNFLFRNDESASDTVLLDFQIIKYGPPMADVLNFLFCNTRKKFRKAHSEELIDFYYECVKHILIKQQYYDIPSKSKYLVLCKDLKTLMKLVCLSDRTVTLMFEHDAVFESDESLRTYLLDERTSNLIKVFNKETTFREIIEEDMLELRDLLFEDL